MAIGGVASVFQGFVFIFHSDWDEQGEVAEGAAYNESISGGYWESRGDPTILQEDKGLSNSQGHRWVLQAYSDCESDYWRVEQIFFLIFNIKQVGNW